MNDDEHFFPCYSDMSLYIDCKLIDLYTGLKACKMGYDLLVYYNYPGIIDIESLQKETDIYNILTLAKFTGITVTVTFESVSVTTNDIIKVIKKVFMNTKSMVNKCCYDPFSESGLCTRNKEEVLNDLELFYKNIMINLKNREKGLVRNKQRIS